MVSICVTSSCVTSTCVMSICVMSSCVMSSCVMSTCAMSICAMSSCVMSVCVCVMSICVVSVCVMSICVMSICVMSICVHSYPERNLHTTSRQTRTPARHQHKIFAPAIGTATPNAIYTQQAAKPARQDQPKIFAPPIGTATPNTIYTQQAAKPACQEDINALSAIYTQQAAKPARQEDINAKFSHLLLAQLPRTQSTHSKPPNSHARKTSTQNFRTCYWHSYPERNLHTASRQTRMPGRHQRKIFAPPIGTATPNAIYTQQAAKPARQQDINAKCSHLFLAQLPRTQFTHSKPPNPHARKTRSGGDPNAPKHTSDPLKYGKPHACHAKAAETQMGQSVQVRQVPRLPRKSGGDPNAPKRTSDPLKHRKPQRLPRKSGGDPNAPATVDCGQ